MTRAISDFRFIFDNVYVFEKTNWMFVMDAKLTKLIKRYI